ncbi:MAG: DsbA family protein [bacterium]|nr:DsbA family protein [bacterium]
MHTQQDLEIIYVGDPMCSWCWGFAPVLDTIRDNYGHIAAFSIIVGGLRPGKSAELMDEKFQDVLRQHWQHVHDASGQPFDFGFLTRESFLYDTEPAARAVVTVRQLAPEKEWSFFNALQKSFYAENVDITQQENYSTMLQEHHIPEDLFLESFNSETTRTATYQDFASSRQMGIQGFPSVVLRKQEQYALLTAGYQPYEALEPPLSRFFSSNES